LHSGGVEGLWETDDFLVDFGDELFETGCFVGRFTVKHLIKDDSHGPDVAFGGVGATVEYFWAHVHGAADQRLMYLVKFCALLVVLSEAEVCNFVGLVLNQYVGGFEVAVDD
jgi:hypothetical protein